MAKQIDIHASLIARCRDQEPSAQAELYRLYAKAMFHVSLRIVGEREDAEDVLQESFVKAFKNINRFRGDSSFGGWLKRIVINRSLDFVKSKVYFDEIKDDQFSAVEEDEIAGPEYEVSDIVAAMKLLPTGFRTVFSLYMFEDHSHQEIADLLGISVGTSKSQLNRAKVKLREQMLQHHEERQA